MNRQEVKFTDKGVMEFQPAWDFQEALLQSNVRVKSALTAMPDEDRSYLDDHPDTTHHLIFLEHTPVYTIGKSGRIENMLVNEERLTLYRINRGGDITFHGPGQLVGYPILDLEKFYRDLGKYLRNVEEVIIRTLADYQISAGRSAGETGVWLDAGINGRERKICAIGIRCSRWVTMHGFAFNVNTNLQYFDNIIPCGIQNKQVTSLQKELGRPVDMEEVKLKVKKYFEEVFEVALVD